MGQVIDLYNKISFFHKIARYERIYLKRNLEQYVGKGYFFHMANDPSLYGLNVKTTYKTPAGIYAYPLTKKMFDDLMDNSLPFKSSSKYIWLLKPKKEPLKASEYTVENLTNDVKKLAQRGTHAAWHLDDMLIASSRNSSVMHPLSRLFYIIYKKNGGFSRNSIFKVSSDFLYLGYTGIYDDLGLGIIHPGEPTQAFFISSKFVDFVELFYNEEEKDIPEKPKTVKNKISDNITTSILHFPDLTLEQKISFVSWVSDNATKEEKLFVINSIPKRYVDIFSEDNNPGVLNAYKLKIGDPNLELDNLEFKDVKLLLNSNGVNNKQKAYLIKNYDCLGTDNKVHDLDEIVTACFSGNFNDIKRKLNKIEKEIILSNNSKNHLRDKFTNAIMIIIKHSSYITVEMKMIIYDICKFIQMPNSKIIDIFISINDVVPVEIRKKLTNNLTVNDLAKILSGEVSNIEFLIDIDSINVDMFFQALYKMPIVKQILICYGIERMLNFIRDVKSDNTAEIVIEILKNVGAPYKYPGSDIFAEIKSNEDMFNYNPKILEYIKQFESKNQLSHMPLPEIEHMPLSEIEF